MGRERQTHLDMGRVDRYVCVCVSSKICVVCAFESLSVYSMSVSGWGYRSGWGLVQCAHQGSWIWPKLK